MSKNATNDSRLALAKVGGFFEITKCDSKNSRGKKLVSNGGMKVKLS